MVRTNAIKSVTAVGSASRRLAWPPVPARQWLRAAGLTLHAAVACCELGRFERALSSYDEALEFFARAAADDPSLADAVAIRSAKARANKARVLLLLGEFEPAL